MRSTFVALGALALGAGSMYFLDPQRGRARRAELGRRGGRMSREAGRRIARGRRRTSAGLRALHAGADALTRPSPPDARLALRVRSRLGHHCSHPRAIHSEVHDGTLTLHGDVLADEADAVIRALASMRGVARVEDHLQRHADAGHVPQLQGRPRPHRAERLPAALVATLCGAAALAALAAPPRLRAWSLTLAFLTLAALGSALRGHRPEPVPNPGPDPAPEREPHDPEDIPIREPEPEPEPATAEELTGAPATDEGHLLPPNRAIGS